MWRCCRVLIVMALTAAACSRAPKAREYQLRGQILGIDRDRREVLDTPATLVADLKKASPSTH